MINNLIISAFYIFTAPSIFGCLIGLTRIGLARSSSLDSVSSDQEELTNRLLSSSLLLPTMKGSTTLSSVVVAGLSAPTPPSISLSWSCGACPLGLERSRSKTEGVEGIRGLFGSGVSTSSSLGAYLGCPKT